MADDKKLPVLIAGAGPVGLMAALRLHAMDVPVILFEKETKLARDLRASTFHPPTLDMLEQFGLAQPLVERGLITPTWQIRLHETHEKAEFDLSILSNETSYPFRLQVEQHQLCELALSLALSKGMDIRMGHTVTGFSQDADSVLLTVSDPDGGESTVNGAYLIAADGGRSRIRSTLDLPFEGLTYPETTILATTPFAFDKHLPGLSNVNYIWTEGGTFSLLHLPGIWRCSLYAGEEESEEEALHPDRIEAKLQRIVHRDERYDVTEIRPYRIHQRIVEDYRHGRILLAGDAAHLNSPSGGMGMNGGIHDAYNLSEKLAKVWRREASDDLLDQYTRQRQPIAKDQILRQAHVNRTRMQQRDPVWRREELTRLQNIASDPQMCHAHLLKSSMIAGLRESEKIE